MKRAFKALALACLLPAAAAALEITGAPAGVKGAAQADFTFGGLTVKGVAFEGGGVVLPVTEHNGKTYIDAKLLSKALYLKLENCFKNGCKPAKAGKAPAVKVEELRPLKSKTRVANAEVSFDGELLAVLGVMASKREADEYWVAFPDSLEFTPGLKEAVTKAVLEAWGRRRK
jgi:hypothetical protein